MSSHNPGIHEVTGGFLTPDEVALKCLLQPMVASFFSRFFSSFNSMVPSGRKDEYTYDTNSGKFPSLNSPIVRFNGFKSTNRLLVPVAGDISGGYSALGDGDPTSHEEIGSRKLQEFMTGKVVKSYQSFIGSQIERLAKNAMLENEATIMINRWWQKMFEAEVIWSLCEGRSSMLTSSDPGGLGLGLSYHPNILVAGNGYVTYSNTMATYKASIINALVGSANITGLYNNGAVPAANETFSSDLLLKAKTTLQRKKIEPTAMVEGKPYWAVSVHSDQMYQLKQDERIISLGDSAYNSKAKEHPSIAGAEIYYEGFAIFDTIVGAPEVHAYKVGGAGSNDDDLLYFGNTTGTGASLAQTRTGKTPDCIEYYAENSPGGDQENALKVGIIWGNRAIGLAVGEEPKMEEYEHPRTPHPRYVDWMVDMGLMRIDDVDKPRTHSQTPTSTDHYGSVLLVTNSPPPSLT